MEELDESRYRNCVHEAAHAVIFAIGRQLPYHLAVAPTGETYDWTFESEDGEVRTVGLGGICLVADAPIKGLMLDWDDEHGYSINFHMVELFVHRRTKAAWRHSVRAYVCGLMAGPIAELVHVGWIPDGEQEVYIEVVRNEGKNDTVRAAAFIDALQFKRRTTWSSEWNHLASITLRTLREPEVWMEVMRIADALYAAGTLEYGAFASLLPEPRKDFPAPRLRRRQ